MTITAFEPNRLVTYTTTQPGPLRRLSRTPFRARRRGIGVPARCRLRATRRDRRLVRPVAARAGNSARVREHVCGVEARASTRLAAAPRTGVQAGDCRRSPRRVRLRVARLACQHPSERQVPPLAQPTVRRSPGRWLTERSRARSSSPGAAGSVRLSSRPRPPRARMRPRRCADDDDLVGVKCS